MKGNRSPEEREAYRLRGKVGPDFVRPTTWPANCESCGDPLTGTRWRFCSEHCGKKSWHAKHQDKYDAWQLKRQRADPRKFAARIAVNDAVKEGRIVRPDTCSSCSKASQYIEGHHHKGYAKPYELDVVWLCKKCHWREHHPREAAA